MSVSDVAMGALAFRDGNGDLDGCRHHDLPA